MPMSQIDLLNERITELRLELKDLARQASQNTRAHFVHTVLLAVFAMAALFFVAGVFGRYPYLFANHLKGSSLELREIEFVDRDGSDMGGIDSTRASLKLERSGDQSEFELNPDRLRLKNSSAVTTIEPYTVADGLSGIRIEGYAADDSKRGGSLFLALPSAEHPKPRLLILDHLGQVVE